MTQRRFVLKGRALTILGISEVASLGESSFHSAQRWDQLAGSANQALLSATRLAPLPKPGWSTKLGQTGGRCESAMLRPLPTGGTRIDPCPESARVGSSFKKAYLIVVNT